MKPTLLQVTFTPAELAEVDKPITAERWGGFQRVIAGILQKTNRATRTVVLKPKEIEACERMAGYVSGGGYEDRYAAIVSAVGRGVPVN